MSLNVTVKMYNLQELVRKTYLEGLINNVVIQFKDNRMRIEAIGAEDEQGVVDQSITLDVSYPCETKENGQVAIKSLATFLKQLESFERDDDVQIVESNNRLIITKPTTLQSMDYEVADIKYIKTYSTGLKTIFGNPIKLIKSDGKEKIISLDSSSIMDAQKLKENGAKISKFNPSSLSVNIKDGKLSTKASSDVSNTGIPIENVTSITGNASSTFNERLLTIIKHGIGTATLRISEGSPIHVHFEHEGMIADYLLRNV